MSSKLEEHATAVATDVLGSGDPNNAIWTILIPIIIQVITGLLEGCAPRTDEEKAAAMRSPTLRQKAALFRELRGSCSSADIGRLTGRTFRAMARRGELLSDDEAIAVVRESVNLLI